MDEKILDKIIQKKEFSQLPERDVALAFSHFEKRETSEVEKIRLTRELLHKVFGAFGSRKLLSIKDKSAEWVLKKHLSARERFEFYGDIYERILRGIGKKLSVVDLGAGVNGFSYDQFGKKGFDVTYTAFESVGQLIDLMNFYFRKSKLQGLAVHGSLFDLKRVVALLRAQNKPRVVFMFKVIDSLEMLQRDYSKELLLELSKFSERIVLSFATESMIQRKRFRAERRWIINFIKAEFNVLDEFELGSEKFVVFCRK